MMNYTQLLETLIAHVIREGASDLHLSVGHHPTIRVTGTLIPLVKENVLAAADTEGLALALMGEGNREPFMRDREIDFAYTFEPTDPSAPGRGMRFRGNAFFQQGKVGVALRAISSTIKNLAELGLPAKLRDFAFKEQGFFLVVGPVGQGKSTTLASLVELVNQERAEHIVTIEDPVEYLFGKGKSIIDQREVRFDTRDFHTALRAMFREDVNVALIGEMRDPETIATAVTAAETGHLVLSTLHTNSAAQTIDRVIDSFPGDQQSQIATQLSNTLLGIFSQRLVPRISGGLIPAYELLIVNPAVANLIRERRTSEINVVIETGSEFGMVDMNHCLAELVRKGEITSDNAYVHSLNPRGLERLI